MKTLSKLLLVDDDEDTLILARYCLKSLKGVDVKFLSSGEEAIQVATQFVPDLILLDVMMPKLDGMAVMKALRSIPSTARIPIVFFTAKIQKEEIDSYLEAGGIDVITKPFDPLTLGSMILKIWNKYQSLQS